jgi:hypothetical protein
LSGGRDGSFTPSFSFIALIMWIRDGDGLIVPPTGRVTIGLSGTGAESASCDYLAW